MVCLVASITFEHVTKDFGGGAVAVDDLSLEIQDGEFMVLLGPSGCGKSTALRMIAGLETLSSGNLSIGNVVVNDVDPRDRDISMVFQSYALYPHMTVRANIESPLRTRAFEADGPGTTPRKLTKGERAERVEATAKALGIDQYLNRKPGALSGGQRQRVALGRAIVARPKAFLMDEPLSNLDAKMRTQTRAELIELHRQVATTIVYVTHDQVEAMTMATRMAVMKDGKLQQVGTPQEVYDKPANLFVAGFVGTPPMNMMEGTVKGDGQVHVAGGDASPAGARLPATGSKVIIGIRPEHLDLASDGIAASVHTVEWLGHETLVSCLVASPDEGGEPSRIVLRTAGHFDAQPGETVHVSASPEHIHVFAATEEGERL